MKKKLLTGLHVSLTYKPGDIPARCAAAALVGAKCPTSAIYASNSVVKATADLFVQEGAALAADELAFEIAFKAASVARTTRDLRRVSLDQCGTVLKAALSGAAKTAADIEGMGMEVLVVQPPPALTKVLVVTVKAGAVKDSVAFHARRLKGLAEYRTQLSVDPMTPTSFTDLVGSHAKRTVTGLVAGQRYWFRVCAIRGEEMGEWSDPVAFVVGG